VASLFTMIYHGMAYHGIYHGIQW